MIPAFGDARENCFNSFNAFIMSRESSRLKYVLSGDGEIASKSLMKSNSADDLENVKLRV